jgi:hypothetical protein
MWKGKQLQFHMLSTIVYYVIKYCVLKVDLVVFVMFCIDDNPLFGFLDE